MSNKVPKTWETCIFFSFFSSVSFDVVLLCLGFVYLQISRFEFVWNCPFDLICFILSIWDPSDVICILLVDEDGGISLDGIGLVNICQQVKCGGMMSSDGTFCLQYVWSEFRLSGFWLFSRAFAMYRVTNTGLRQSQCGTPMLVVIFPPGYCPHLTWTCWSWTSLTIIVSI